jgi:transcriptional regulator with GAF, ATPase, and Fis domain
MRHPTSTPDAPEDQSPDLPTVVRLLQSVSREIVLGKLIDRVLTFALEHATAARGLFVLLRDGVRAPRRRRHHPSHSASSTRRADRPFAASRRSENDSAAMSEKNRVAYVLVKEEGLSIKEAAAVLGTTAAVVRQRAHRAYMQLRTALSAAGWTQAGNDGSWEVVSVRG